MTPPCPREEKKRKANKSRDCSNIHLRLKRNTVRNPEHEVNAVISMVNTGRTRQDPLANAANHTAGLTLALLGAIWAFKLAMFQGWELSKSQSGRGV